MGSTEPRLRRQSPTSCCGSRGPRGRCNIQRRSRCGVRGSPTSRCGQRGPQGRCSFQLRNCCVGPVGDLRPSECRAAGCPVGPNRLRYHAVIQIGIWIPAPPRAAAAATIGLHLLLLQNEDKRHRSLNPTRRRQDDPALARALSSERTPTATTTLRLTYLTPPPSRPA